MAKTFKKSLILFYWHTAEIFPLQLEKAMKIYTALYETIQCCWHIYVYSSQTEN